MNNTNLLEEDNYLKSLAIDNLPNNTLVSKIDLISFCFLMCGIPDDNIRNTINLSRITEKFWEYFRKYEGFTETFNNFTNKELTNAFKYVFYLPVFTKYSHSHVIKTFFILKSRNIFKSDTILADVNKALTFTLKSYQNYFCSLKRKRNTTLFSKEIKHLVSDTHVKDLYCTLETRNFCDIYKAVNPFRNNINNNINVLSNNDPNNLSRNNKNDVKVENSLINNNYKKRMIFNVIHEKKTSITDNIAYDDNKENKDNLVQQSSNAFVVSDSTQANLTTVNSVDSYFTNNNINNNNYSKFYNKSNTSNSANNNNSVCASLVKDNDSNVTNKIINQIADDRSKKVNKLNIYSNVENNACSFNLEEKKEFLKRENKIRNNQIKADKTDKEINDNKENRDDHYNDKLSKNDMILVDQSNQTKQGKEKVYLDSSYSMLNNNKKYCSYNSKIDRIKEESYQIANIINNRDNKMDKIININNKNDTNNINNKKEMNSIIKYERRNSKSDFKLFQNQEKNQCGNNPAFGLIEEFEMVEIALNRNSSDKSDIYNNINYKKEKNYSELELNENNSKNNNKNFINNRNNNISSISKTKADEDKIRNKLTFIFFGNNKTLKSDVTVERIRGYINNILITNNANNNTINNINNDDVICKADINSLFKLYANLKIKRDQMVNTKVSMNADNIKMNDNEIEGNKENSKLNYNNLIETNIAFKHISKGNNENNIFKNIAVNPNKHINNNINFSTNNNNNMIDINSNPDTNKTLEEQSKINNEIKVFNTIYRKKYSNYLKFLNKLSN